MHSSPTCHATVLTQSQRQLTFSTLRLAFGGGAEEGAELALLSFGEAAPEVSTGLARPGVDRH